MQINLELYRVFYMAAKYGSLTKAAHELYISQPAVSQSIKLLESQLGGKLFVRTNKGMKLTYEGKIVYEYIKQANALIDMAEKKFSELQELSIGEVNIAASDTLTKHFLASYIRRFHDKYDGIAIKITNRTTQESVSLLREYKVDLALISTPYENANGLNIKDCIEVNDVFVCAPSYLPRIHAPLSVTDLNSYPLIMLEKLSNSRHAVDMYMDSLGVTLAPALELGALDSVNEFTKLGMGIGLCTREFIRTELSSGQLVEVPVSFTMPPRAYAIAVNQDVPLSFAATRFVNMLLGKK